MIQRIKIFLLVGGVAKVSKLDNHQKVILYSKGIMERTENFIFLMLMTILISWNIILLWVFALLVFMTAF